MNAEPLADEPGPRPNRVGGAVLVGSIFLVAICGLVYELIAGALSSYLLGDSVTQFSLVIGVFLSAMGAGSYVSRYFRVALLARLIQIETLVGILGGLTALAGFAAFALTDWYSPVLLTLVLAVGVLVGLEIPLVIRILRELHDLRLTLANVLSADYIGALAASLLFPFVLLPELGLVHAGLLMGLLNVAVAGLLVWWFRAALAGQVRRLTILVAVGAAVLVGAAIGGRTLVRLLESRMYQDEIIYAQDSPYQRIVLTRWREDVRLFLDGHLQFSSIDEYRYHECLIHPALSLVREPQQVLILGGGDGLAVREVLKHAAVQHIDLVDLDPQITTLFAQRPLLTALNGGALSDVRVTIHNVDAMKFLESGATPYDVIVMDLPDPSRPALAKLYLRWFFALAARRLSAEGLLVTQATSPFASRAAFWCIVHTMQSVEIGADAGEHLSVAPYHAYVPTFGTWGFVLAGRRLPDISKLDIAVPTRFLTAAVASGLFVFPPDLAEVPTAISTLDDPVVVRLYSSGYHQYFE